MALQNTIVLRPRFNFKLNTNNASVLDSFEAQKFTQNTFKVTRVDEHVFIRFPKHKQHLWSPQLHLEINATETNTSVIYGLFGPSPTLWTLFMFLHFGVAVLFCGFGIWAYTNFSLNQSYAIPLSLMVGMVIIWIALYVFGRLGKAKGQNEMHELHRFMKNTLSEFY